MANGTSPHTPGVMVGSGRSWGAHQYSGAGGANFAMRSPASMQQQYMGMPPPPPQAVSSPWGFAGVHQGGGPMEDDSGYDRRSTPTTSASGQRKMVGGDPSGFAQFSSPPLEPSHPSNPNLENALAEWDPFFGDFEEELGTSGGSGGAQPSDYYSPSTHAKHTRGPGGSGGSGGKKDYAYANSPKQVGL